MATEDSIRQRKYNSQPEQIKKRAQRNAARAEAEKAGKVKKGDGKDLDHKNPIRNGGSNAPSNLRVTTPAKNRAWRKGKTGY